MPRCSCCSSSSSPSSSHLPITPPQTTKSEIAAIKQSDGLSDGLEKRVLDATSELSMDRCIIRNTGDSTCYSHVLSRTTPEHIISRLEYSWGMNYGQLNVDSSSNIIRLSSDLHRSFHHRLWVLIPEDPSVLRSYRRHKKRGPVDNNFSDLIPAGPYRYKFVVSRYFKGTSIDRWPESTEEFKGAAKDTSPDQFEYPFTNFPTVVSHVHPRFAIYHAGYTFKKRLYNYYVSREDLRKPIEKILSIYCAWTKPIPADAIRSFVRVPKSLDPADDRNDIYGENISERSGVTRAGRFNWARKGLPDDSEAPVGSLESGTLLVFDALVPHDTPKDDSISRWLAEVPAFSNEFDADPISNAPLN